jgi:hypothetical protein
MKEFTMKTLSLGALAGLLLIAALPATAAELTATVAAVSGKVQVQNGKAWDNVDVGQTLAIGSTVATGFRSELKLKIGPSTVTVKALSRLTISSLVQNGTDANTDLYLKVGKVNAEVNKDDTIKTQKFTVKSPVATASVRGTEFSFDGVRLEVQRGLVAFSDSRGNQVAVPAGESAKAALPETRAAIQSNVAQVLEASVTVANAGGPGADAPTDLREVLQTVAAAVETKREEVKEKVESTSKAVVYVGGLLP